MTERLPAVPWTRRKDLAALVDALGPGNLRWVGGAVRDTLLDLPVKDIDGATTLPPNEVIARAKKAGLRTVPTGIDHGTVTVLLPDGPVEVTTLRHDVSTDGRRATVAYASDWRDDAARRDFTINALYADPVTRDIFDYHDGLADLAARRVRFIGDAQERIREDHLRILRYFRFQARFGAELDPQAEQACTELAETLKGLSRERVAMELLNLLALPDPSSTVARMFALGILPVILPETHAPQIAALQRLIAAERNAGIAPDPLRRLAALIPAAEPIADSVAARLRLSGKQRKRLASIAERKPDDTDHPRMLAYREGMEAAVDRLLIAGHPITALHGWSIPELPIKGRDVVAAGVTAGPLVARTLRTVENRWLAEGFPDANRVAEILAEVLGQRD
ncbi:putative tRNA nucleotidyltransferase [Caenibius tardaugens NBRC 16725]|uniref:Putative tRNA nucleotidyltransferase n=1 Tax=Caenibius tardaugens NBRC 16725 TaxID=1219035 RepID=U2Y4U2_9SPHN|nr:CCA tRNA nucleotidyltransferase [Caenibius tardaugens]AZI34625.1 CCA tRNA nucleotidyltransferase [Caenibius tardaugens NBRC 16725]GAD48131.1 putative tRNA nucleotidyltransferase [Caenibius tardaugens NBRC 16725]